MRKGKKQTKNNLEIKDKIKQTEESPFVIKEAYKEVSTNILFSLVEEGCKCIAITSAYPQEGKTTTATNMSISFVQMGKRTLLIDGDMRKPYIHKMFDLENDIGLSNVLGGFVETKDAIKCIEGGLHIMTSGHILPNPAELLSSQRMKDLMMELRDSYDYIFIDTSPVNVVTDGIIISECVSGVIVVTKQSQSKHSELQEALGKLNFAKAKVLGVVLTGVESKMGRFSKYLKLGKHRKYKGYGEFLS